MDWNELEQLCLSCQDCPLGKTRTKVVIGDGNKEAKIMLVGEGPGYNEDMQGLAFVGEAGQLLDKMLAQVGLNRQLVYIANIVKCRPPNNRDPLMEEQLACIKYLRYQFALVKPQILVCLGRIAAQAIIGESFRITKQRGIWYKKGDCHIIATYHPAALLRDINKQPYSLADFKAVAEKYTELRNNI